MSRIWAFLRKRISFYSLVCMILIYWIIHFDLQGVELVIRGTSVLALRLMLLYGVVIGWLLGRTDFKPWVSGLTTIISGFVIVVFHIGGIDSSLWDLVKVGFSYLLRLVFQEGMTDPSPLLFQLSVIQPGPGDDRLEFPVILVRGEEARRAGIGAQDAKQLPDG